MSKIEQLKKECFGAISNPEDMAEVIKENRLQMVLVRCGNGRFVCPAQNADHFIEIVNKEGSDYVRDVSIQSER